MAELDLENAFSKLEPASESEIREKGRGRMSLGAEVECRIWVLHVGR